MTASKTATVETLTAEVRVLMVGSRQVTLSVYGQLDEAERMEVFGRVNPKTAAPGYVYFIGRNPEDGSLVRGSVPATENAVRNENRDLWRAIHDSRNSQERLSAFVKRHSDSYPRCSMEDHSQCKIYASGRPGDSRIVRQVAEVEADIQRLRTEIAELQRTGDQEIAQALALADKIAAAPLIVLAGLR